MDESMSVCECISMYMRAQAHPHVCVFVYHGVIYWGAVFKMAL